MSILDDMGEFKKLTDDLNRLLDNAKSYPQQDRKLSNGKVKSATGYVNEPTCTDRDDYPADLESNW